MGFQRRPRRGLLSHHTLGRDARIVAAPFDAQDEIAFGGVSTGIGHRPPHERWHGDVARGEHDTHGRQRADGERRRQGSAEEGIARDEAEDS